ncbi:reverse transcriptase family protein [Brevundimonas sp.]|uniref:reverse transcriptase family protein n=1 Tax=Brevundimonas sp. TaxID=1871086 RepID=UPI002730C1F8|nr:reverse transcriptase family protein [Brevundimonas sp.]MDP1913800.1 reverse transcriptase family protein [Brevundimonas sp.]
MPTPNSQRYASAGRRQGIDQTILDHALTAFGRIRATDPRITPVLTLRHFSVLTGLPYLFLRRTIARRSGTGYRFVYLKKRIPGRSSMRMISIPPESLALAQRWLVDNVLRYTQVHTASFAFHPESSPVQAAEQHPNTKWLLKVDIEDFFHSVSEGTVSAIFARLGFQKLLAFEFGRLCTIAVDRGPSRNPKPRTEPIALYASDYEGFLPQGAPTSPMLANLAMMRTDTSLAQCAKRHGFRYSRYADDLAFSSDAERSIAQMRNLKVEVCRLLNQAGFTPNLRKTVIRGPGTRRIVLGMLVDGPSPRLSREYKDNIRLHLHYLTDPAFGPAKHALARKTAVSSLYHHVRGLIGWAKQVEPDYGHLALEEFKAVDWPLVQPRQIEEAWDE